MSRLFDANAKATQEAQTRRSREEVQQRYAAAEQMLAEAGLLDAADKRLQVQLSQSVSPIVYESFRIPGQKWKLEHARAGDDYVFQLFPLKPTKLPWQDVIVVMIATMDSIFPKTLQITYRPPKEEYQIKFYTITVAGVVGQPGWERACRERALHGLAAINAWPG